ncbi:hypothetical protein PU00_11565 [Hafnia alvei]|uniref:hypothetical protein n=1 Tax=Hafnia alvei TaxID=569 RepID=UPI000582EE37|nr:hypothetical protein [Hafnia alvei]KID03536.1 hypothetical protein PU00_11565 [Hafnia alvei]
MNNESDSSLAINALMVSLIAAIAKQSTNRQELMINIHEITNQQLAHENHPEAQNIADEIIRLAKSKVPMF